MQWRMAPSTAKKGKKMTWIMIGIMWFGIGVYAGIHIAESCRKGGEG